MAGCLRSAVLLALRSKVIETIGRLPGLFEKLLQTPQKREATFHGKRFLHRIRDRSKKTSLRSFSSGLRISTKC
jgi:hypothetical protein